MNRPFVCVNMAMTADGKITSAGREYPRFTTRKDHDHMDRLRAEADALLIGAETLRSDDPLLHVRSEEMQAYRRSLGKPEGLLRVLVTASLRIDDSSHFFDATGNDGRIIATVESAPADRLAALEGRAEIWKVGPSRVDLPRLFGKLKERGVDRLLAEGGGELNWALVRDDLLDELHVTIVPALLGGRDAPTLLEGEGLTMKLRRRLRLVEVRREEDELYCRYTVAR